MARSVCASASGSARATWSRVRSAVRGVRSSCEALATNRRCDSNDASSRPNRLSRVSPSSANSSARLPRATRRSRLLAEMSRAVAVIVRRGRRNRPAISQPTASDTTTRPTTVATARMTCPWESAWIWAMVAALAPSGIDCWIVRTGTMSTATPQAKKNPA